MSAGIPRVVSTEALRGLRAWFDRKRIRVCSTYNEVADTMYAELNALPELAPGWTDYHAARAVLNHYVCHRLSASCGWSGNLLGKLQALKTALPTETP